MWRHNCRLCNNHVKDTQGHGWLCHVGPRCMISKGNQLALSCLPSVKKQKHFLFCFAQCLIKELLDSVFVISRIIKVVVRVIPTSTLIILNILKTSSNNCLQCGDICTYRHLLYEWEKTIGCQLQIVMIKLNFWDIRFSATSCYSLFGKGLGKFVDRLFAVF